MRLEQHQKELAAIGASIGANCRPCIEHHLPAGREAGLSDTELADAVATAQAVRHQAVELLSARVEELLGRGGPRSDPRPLAETSRARELVALGASVGANSHHLLRVHISAALEMGLGPAQVEAALKMAEHVQRRAAEMIAEKAILALEDARSAVAGAEEDTPSGPQPSTLSRGMADSTAKDAPELREQLRSMLKHEGEVSRA